MKADTPVLLVDEYEASVSSEVEMTVEFANEVSSLDFCHSSIDVTDPALLPP